MFLLGVPDYNTPRIHSVMSHMLARGNFSNLYSYGRPSEQQLAQGDDAQYEEQGLQQQQQGNAAADGSKAAAAASSYPADTHYVDITEAIRQPDAEFVLTHSDFLFTREPLSGTLHINMPKKLVWDWQVPPTAPPTTPATAATGDSNSTAAAAAAGGAATTPAPMMGPAPAGVQAAGAAESQQTERLVTVYTPVSATQQRQQQQER